MENDFRKLNLQKPILIFDRDCPVCFYFSKIARSFGFSTRSIQESQDILQNLVGENFPFAFYLIDSKGIFWGKYAAKRMFEIKGFGPFSILAYVVYPLISSLNRNSEKFNTCSCRLHGRIYFD